MSLLFQHGTHTQMEKYIFLLNNKYGKKGVMFKECEDGKFKQSLNFFYGHKEANFYSLYRKEISGKNSFDIYIEEFVTFENLQNFKPKLTFEGTLKELDDFILANDEKYHFYHDESEVRTLLISLHTGDWYIETGVEGDDCPDDFPIFGQYDCKDGKIYFIHEHSIWDKHIKRAKKFGSMFLETCIFTYEDTSFKGTFINALEFINKELNEKGDKYISKDNFYTSGKQDILYILYETQTLKPLINLNHHIRKDDEIIASSIENSGIDILLLHEASKYKDEDGDFLEYYSRKHLKNYTYIRYDLDGKMLNKTSINNEEMIFCHVNFLPSFEVLLTCPWHDVLDANSIDKNAKVYDQNGKFARDFSLQNGVCDVKVDLNGNIWVAYFEQATYFGDKQGNLSSGLECWDSHGKNLWSFKPIAGIEKIFECFALTIDDENNTWINYYAEFPIVKINSDKNIKFWYPLSYSTKGSTSLHVYGDKILTNESNDKDDFDVFDLYEIHDKEFDIIKCVEFATPDDFNLFYSTLLPSVGSHIGFLHENQIYLTNMKEVVYER